MRYWINTILLVVSVVLLSGLSACSNGVSGLTQHDMLAAGPQDAYISEGYKLIWHDEFNVDGRPNPDNWKFSEGFLRNEEHQWYQQDNAFCRDGLLVIEARREEKRPSPMHDPDKKSWKHQRKYIEYTSAAMSTNGLHAWKFGRFEVRAKIDPRLGSWPAFWTLGVDGRWPSGGEVDILEYYQGKFLGNAFWGGCEGTGNKSKSGDVVIVPLADFGEGWADEFHVYTMDWDENFIRIYIDEKLLNEIDLSKTINKDLSRGPENPFHQPHYIIVNQAIGGNCGGDPSQTQFPMKLEVDYVRVYQKAN